MEGYPPQDLQEKLENLPIGVRYRLCGLAERAIRSVGWEDIGLGLSSTPSPFNLLGHAGLQGIQAIEDAQAEIIEACASVSEQTNPN